MARQTITGIWANAAAAANITAPTTTKVNNGWVAEKPSFRIFNWFWQKITNMIQNVEKYGIMEWSAETLYPLYGLALDPTSGTVYKSKQANNLNHAVTDTAWWEVAIVSKAYVDGTVSKTANGYQILPSGLVMQWGIKTGSGGVTFPIAFETACLNITLGAYNPGNSSSDFLCGISNGTITVNGFTLSLGGGTTAAHWFAIGY